MLDFLDREQCDEKFGRMEKFPRGVVDSQLCIGMLEKLFNVKINLIIVFII